MRESIYTYFKNIYADCSDAVVCFDDKLNLVYATDGAQKLLGVSDANTHLSCLFSLSELNKIKETVGAKKYFTFEYISELNKLPIKATVTPVFLEKIYYYVITLLPTYKSELDRVQKYGIEVCVDAASSAIVKSTTDIANIVSRLENEHSDLAKQIINNIFTIRKQFYNIEAMATSKLQEPSKYVVELGSYLERITSVITRHIGENKIQFAINVAGVLVSRVSYQALDLIVCNVVSALLCLGLGKAKITINAFNSNGSNIIMVSSAQGGVRNFKDVYASGSKSNMLSNSTDMSIEVVKKLTADCGGSVKFTQHNEGGFAFVITLPESPVRDRVLFAPNHCYDLNEQFSIVKVMLSDIDEFLI